MMKKTNKLFLMMCVAGSFALLFGSCKKNEEVKEVKINLPAFEEEVDSRAYVDYGNGSKFMWNANDEIAVYNLEEAGIASKKAIFATDESAEGRAIATFTNTGEALGEKLDGFFVFYPVSKVQADLMEGNYQTFTVPATQTYTFDPAGTPTIDPEGMALACEVPTLTDQFSLKHIFGALRLHVYGTGVVNKIVVEDNHYNLSGSVSMKVDKVNMTTFSSLQTAFISAPDPETDPAFYGGWNEYKQLLDYSANGTGKTMTLECGNAELQGDQEVQFMIGLRPGALKYGYTLKLYLDGSDTPLEFVNGGADSWNYGIKAGINKNVTIDLR